MHKDSLKKQIAEYVIRNKEKYYRLAYSYVKNPDDALDIIQESIYKAVSNVDSLKGSDYIKVWFYRIVVNTSLDFLRKRRKIVAVEDEVLIGLDSGINDKYENFDLKEALDNLPEKYRVIVILRYFEDLKIEEIAEILSENISTIKTRLYKSLKMLRVEMNDYEEA
ncbi:sigma-70 family RNA polymerase sigma factor [Clostridium sp. YIM B02515]|uniref:Sigma-70 family RNA polymerase sigma factor n=1 Tax=Clostridium rhizosphaerae TaxID=2803861 RepID=A0ABS1TD59_9CLOT|nr:sigma-70 family RNA polymerase sigma factor [Clostridium rhizosphaerae]MBL4937293.1 sigma-70 family RNA polymerase sigma factor [Clostridium rhizosphaerae]